MEVRYGTAPLDASLAFVDQLGRDFPNIAPTTQEARERMAESIQRCGGPVAYMRGIMAEIDGQTATI